MTPLENPAIVSQFLDGLAAALEDGLGVPAAFAKAASASDFDPATIEAHLTLRSLDGKLTCSSLLDGLVSDETLTVIRAGEKSADVIGHLRQAATDVRSGN
jgi:hypothetical protein